MHKDVTWILNAIEEIAQTAIMPDGIAWRATYTEEDKKCLAQLQSYMRTGGMSPYFDEVGNLLGRIPGHEDAVILAGSHRDTVRQGGKYDGMLGVLTALKAAASLYAELGKPKKTVEVVAFCEEESSRFITNYLGSSYISGFFHETELNDLDKQKITLGDAMRNHGYLQAPLKGKRSDIQHYLELHIEQGGVLESKEKEVGIVTTVVGQISGEIHFYGRQNHAGTTPMNLRQDPMPVAAQFISRLFAWAKQYSDDLVCTVGRMVVQPGSVNVIPSHITMGVDIRSTIPELLNEARQVIRRLKEELEQETAGQPFGSVPIEIDIPSNEPPVPLDPKGISDLERLAGSMNMDYHIMPSGAGHDAAIIAQAFPSNLIFVPSVGGISHNPEEYTKPEGIAAGYQLFRAYLKELAW